MAGRRLGRDEEGRKPGRREGGGKGRREREGGRKEPRQGAAGTRCTCLQPKRSSSPPPTSPSCGAGRPAHPSPKRSRVARASRILSHVFWASISGGTAERQGPHAGTALVAAWGQVEGDESGRSAPGSRCLGQRARWMMLYFASSWVKTGSRPAPPSRRCLSSLQTPLHWPAATLNCWLPHLVLPQPSSSLYFELLLERCLHITGLSWRKRRGAEKEEGLLC